MCHLIYSFEYCMSITHLFETIFLFEVYLYGQQMFFLRLGI